jgi:hypothetical protein
MEVHLNSYTTWGALVQQDDLEYLKISEASNPQIYFIGKRPRITYDPVSIKIDTEGLITGTAFAKTKEKDYSVEFGLKIYPNENDSLTVGTHFPYSKLEIKNNNKVVTEASMAYILAQYGTKLPPGVLDLEILYIGQSMSNSIGYSIVDRLKRHSTLQAIYAEAIRNFPDHDIWIGLFHFDCQQFSMFGGPALIDGEITENSFKYDVEIDYDDEKKRLDKITNSNDIDQQYINFTEAALIRYFQPAYNQKFKKKFPNPAHSSYESCYNLDMHSISVAFLTDSIQSRVYTDKVKPDQEHGITFPLHNAEDRKNIFDLL